ncbi:hypothetical protein [Luteipulveratus halotolerans]|uniref:hypothetical protein n=1 Tax=Luteipulveratus halotolerans TaxID=1631356 RepID=UPI0012FB2DC1|nr:hypothetical protein [Luteipulveratus halotolerans]
MTAIVDLVPSWPRQEAGHWGQRERKFVFTPRIPSREAGARFPDRPSLTTATPAMKHVSHLIEEICDDLGHDAFEAKTVRNIFDFLRQVTTAESTFPSIVPDDDGVAVLHWVAGERHLQVDIDSDGPSYLWVKVASESFSLTDPSHVRTLSKAVLASMAEEVWTRNPFWRQSMLQR